MIRCIVDNRELTLTLKSPSTTLLMIKRTVSNALNQNMSDRFCVHNDIVLSDESIINTDGIHTKTIVFCTKEQLETHLDDQLYWKRLDNMMNMNEYKRIKQRKHNKKEPTKIILYQPKKETIVPTTHEMGIKPLPKFW